MGMGFLLSEKSKWRDGDVEWTGKPDKEEGRDATGGSRPPVPGCG